MNSFMRIFIPILSLAVALSLNAAKKITISGNDTMQFDTKEFEVNSGEKVELELKNTGKLPKIAMGHNLVILKKGISSLKFGQRIMGLGASATNPLPEASMDEVLAPPNFLVLGNPIRYLHRTEPGDYQFVCISGPFCNDEVLWL